MTREEWDASLEAPLDEEGRSTKGQFTDQQESDSWAAAMSQFGS